MLTDNASLVKFSTPVLINSGGRGRQTNKHKKQPETHHTQDILAQILPPKEHKTDNGQLWVQTVLSTPATKIQVTQLSEQLNKRLVSRQARQVGLCPVRQELYDQCFDEVIRQITIDCRQRGLLLVRVRDEYRNQIKSYKNLYESSINHGMRRVIEADKKKQKMNAQIIKLEKQCSALQRSVNDMGLRIKEKKEVEEHKLKEKEDQHYNKVKEIKEGNAKIKHQIQVALQKQK